MQRSLSDILEVIAGMSKHLTLLFTADFFELPPTLQREVYIEFYKLTYPLVYFILKDHQLAEDVIQESFLRVLDKSKQLDDIKKMESWIKTLSRNVAINFFRKLKKARNELGADDVFIYRMLSENGRQLSPDEEVEANLIRESIESYIHDLKPEYRQLIEMRWIGQLSYKEMAATLGIPENGVKQKLYRAREAIRAKLKEEWGLKDE